MAVPRSLKNATVTFYDSDGGESTELTLEDGDLSINIPVPVEHVADRGNLGALIEAADEPLTFSMTCQVGAVEGTEEILDIVTGVATSWDYSIVTTGSGTFNGKTSSLAAVASAVKVFQIVVVLADPAGGASETMYLFNCVASISFQEGMPSKWTLTGTSYMTFSDFIASVA